MKQTKTHNILTDEEHGNDMLTSYHSYLMDNDLPDMLKVVNEHIDDLVLDHNTKLELMDFRTRLEKLLEISKKFGTRKYSFQSQD